MRLLHIADIHIGTKFVNKRAAVRQVLKQSVMNAFKKSIEYAIDEGVDGVLIAGDLFDGGEVPFHGEVGFLKLMDRIEEARIHVFYTTGNHDPYRQNQLFNRLKAYQFIHPFYRPVPETVTVTSDNGIIYKVTSAGHDGETVQENIIKDFPVKSGDVPHVGIAHTMVASIKESVDHGDYMPCSLEDLKSKGYDYFALGHIHKRLVLDESNRIGYSGNIQGRHYKETGPKGGVLVEINDDSIRTTFVPFHELEWHQETISLDEEDTSVYDVITKMKGIMSTVDFSNRQWIGRFQLEGSSLLYHSLQKSSVICDLEEEICEELGALDIRIKSDKVSPLIDREELKRSEHLLGSFLNRFDENPSYFSRYLDTVDFISHEGKTNKEAFLNKSLASLDKLLIGKIKK